MLPFIVLLLQAAAPEPPWVAMVLKVDGEATLQCCQEALVCLYGGDQLRPGDQLRLADQAGLILLVIKDGHKDTRRPGTPATVQETGSAPAQAVASWESSQLPARALNTLQGHSRSGRAAGVIVRGPDGKDLPRLSPLPGSNLLTDRHAFSWPADQQAARYFVELATGPDERSWTRLWRVETTEPRLDFPKDRPALEGVLHRWRVTACLTNGDDKVIVNPAIASFAVATGHEKKLLQELGPLMHSDGPTDWLLAAEACEARAVFEEARKLYLKLADKLPDDARAQETLAGYYRNGGQIDLAEKAEAQARQLRQPGGK
jgi:hypothetical protein